MNSNPENTQSDEKNVAERKHCGGRRRWVIPFFVAGAMLVKSAIAFYLWNALVPDLFHGPTLTFLQTLGLLILAKIFFGFGFRGRHGHGRFGHHRFKHWQGLSPEEREKLRSEMRSRC